MNAQRWQRFSLFTYKKNTLSTIPLVERCFYTQPNTLLARSQTFSIENTTSVAFELNGCFKLVSSEASTFRDSIQLRFIYTYTFRACVWYFFLVIYFRKFQKPFSNLAWMCVMLLCVRIQHLFNWFIHPFHNAMWKLFPVFWLKFSFLVFSLFFSILFLFYLCVLFAIFFCRSDKTNYLKVQPFVNDMCLKYKNWYNKRWCEFKQKYKCQV